MSCHLRLQPLDGPGRPVLGDLIEAPAPLHHRHRVRATALACGAIAFALTLILGLLK